MPPSGSVPVHFHTQVDAELTGDESAGYDARLDTVTFETHLIQLLASLFTSYLSVDSILFPLVSLHRVLVMLLLLALAHLFKNYGTQAASLSPSSSASSALEVPIFARDDAFHHCHSRTVLDILWSCLATTFACTWVSVHPNVPWYDEGKWTILRRRIFLMFFSILAPEFMIMWAFKQWRGAVMIRDAVNEAILGASPDKREPIRKPWTTTHGHLLQMGGFRVCATARENFFWGGSVNLGPRNKRPLAVDGSNPFSSYTSRIHRHLDGLSPRRWDVWWKAEARLMQYLIPANFHYRHETSERSWCTEYAVENALTDNIWEGTLTFDSLKALLSENLIHFPIITEDEINDKSKGDALSKGIALLQLTWFIVQISTRAAQGLAITEFELTTAALAGLNSVMYVFWWSKPHDVRFPVVIRTKGVEELLAKKAEDITWNFLGTEFDVEFRDNVSKSSALVSLKDIIKSFKLFFASLSSRTVSAVSKLTEVAGAFSCRIYSPVNRTDDGDSQHWDFNLCVENVMKCATLPFFYFIYLIDLLLVLPASSILGESGSYMVLSYPSSPHFHKLSRNTSFISIFSSSDVGVMTLLTTSSVAGILFGVVHCVAWNFSFATRTEQILWRTASTAVAGTCALTFTGACICLRLINGGTRGNASLSDMVTLIIFTPISLAYSTARITLLVLSLTSLRSLPTSAFDTVQWVELVPHI